MLFNKIAIKVILLSGLGILLLLSTSCVEVKKARLYDGVEVAPLPVKPTEISMIVEPLIYDEDATDVWGLENDVCKEARVTDAIAYSGKESLEVTWNRNAEGCDWAGIGIGWDGYAGKDLSEIMDFVAIQMYVRTQKGRSFALPIVLTLEDYSGGMSFSYTGNKYFERSTIDEEWQRVLVPLNTFDIKKDGLDASNIKQLQIELQQSGSIYLDDISLVFYEPEEQEPWMEEEVLPNPLAMPIQLFDDAFINNNVWGLLTDACQKITLSEQESSEGQKSVYAKWDTNVSDCKLTAFGVSWNKWFPVDVTSIRQSAVIQFDVKSLDTSSDQVNIKVGFEDYDRAKSSTSISDALSVSKGNSKKWKTVSIPLSSIPEGIDFTRIKHLFFQLEKSGEVYIDNIRLTRP